MRTKLLVLILVPLFAACKLDVLGPGDWDLGGGWDPGGWDWPTPAFQISGMVRVGEYDAGYREATVYFYEPSDTLTPIDSTWTGYDGRYSLSWWAGDSLRDVCDWLARGVMWSGEMGALTPLFDEEASSCDLDATYLTTATLETEYEPLETPFVLSGTVLIDERPARVEVAVPTRMPNPEARPVVMTAVSDAEGVYRFGTTDARLRFTWCRSMWAGVTGPGGVDMLAELGEVYDLRTCLSGRTFPDVRFGSTKAISGHVQVAFGPNVYRPANAGEAEVTLLDANDSTAVLGPVQTLDDGTFHMWWSLGGGFPGCAFMLSVELADDRSVVVPMLGETQQCRRDLDRWVQVD
jgi:hypothetical protein